MDDFYGWFMRTTGLIKSLVDEDNVYRAISDKDWIKQTNGLTIIKPNACLRRKPPKDRNGISVNPTTRCTIEVVKRPFKRGFWGVGVINVGAVRQLGRDNNYDLDVLPDRQTHANIVNLPHKWDPDDEKKKQAQFFARELAKIAQYQPLGIDDP